MTLRKKLRKAPRRKRAASKRGPGEFEVFSVDQSASARAWCIYGGSGTGKTTLAGSFPSPVLLLDVNDRGQDSVRDKVDTVKLRPVHKWLDLEQTFWHLHSNPDEYGTICLDTVSELQQKAVEAVTGWDIGESGTPPTMNQQLWGKVSSLMNTWITQFKSLTDLGIEVVFICQEKYFGGGEDADPELQIDPEIGPRVIPSVADHLEAQCSAILNTFIRRKLTRKRVGKKIKEVGEIQFCVRVGPDPVYVTKMRKPKSIILPDIVVDVEYPDLIKLLKGV